MPRRAGGSFYCQSVVASDKARNEDSVVCSTLPSSGYTLLAVADGLGGHAAGEVASQTAIETLESTLKEQIANEVADRRTLLESGYSQVNQRINEFSSGRDFERDPGTTLVATLIDSNDAIVANVGDSRAYRYDENLEQITVDQTKLQEMIEAGEITAEEAKDHPAGDRLTQAMGLEESLEIDFYDQTMDLGRLILCSDGLTDPITDSEIARIMAAAATVEEAGDTLIDRTDDVGRPDDVSVALYEPA